MAIHQTEKTTLHLLNDSVLLNKSMVGNPLSATSSSSLFCEDNDCHAFVCSTETMHDSPAWFPDELRTDSAVSCTEERLGGNQAWNSHRGFPDIQKLV